MCSLSFKWIETVQCTCIHLFCAYLHVTYQSDQQHHTYTAECPHVCTFQYGSWLWITRRVYITAGMLVTSLTLKTGPCSWLDTILSHWFMHSQGWGSVVYIKHIGLWPCSCSSSVRCNFITVTWFLVWRIIYTCTLVITALTCIHTCTEFQCYSRLKKVEQIWLLGVVWNLMSKTEVIILLSTCGWGLPLTCVCGNRKNLETQELLALFFKTFLI